MQVVVVSESLSTCAELCADLSPRLGAVCVSQPLPDAVLRGARVWLLDAAGAPSPANCLSLCRQLAEDRRTEAPIMILGATDQLSDKLEGFAAGADDYLARPFDRQELQARLDALTRRRRRSADDALLIAADLQYDPHTCEVRRGGSLIRLGPISRRLLHLLLSEAPRVVTRERLEREIWGERLPERDLLRSHMSMLRKAIDKGYEHKLIQTVHGTGFRLVG